MYICISWLNKRMSEVFFLRCTFSIYLLFRNIYEIVLDLNFKNTGLIFLIIYELKHSRYFLKTISELE